MLLLRKKELYFFILLLLVGLTNLVDFYVDLSEGSDYFHLIMEGFLAIAAIGGLILLLREARLRRQQLEVLTSLDLRLQKTEQSLNETQAELQRHRHEYIKIIQRQFGDWGLTAGEKDVAMLLLKGLSFEEIAAVRKTKEKTVRQQASNIYKKSGINGRHAFSAWFFEDFIQ